LSPGGARNVLTRLLAGWLSSALGAGASAGEAVELSDGQVHAAQVQAMTTVCEEETPAVAAHIEQSYLEWLDRNYTPCTSDSTRKLG
jgi:hypothetical protein